MCGFTRIIIATMLSLAMLFEASAELMLGPDTRGVPGEIPTPIITYRHAGATNVALAGDWSQWDRNIHPLKKVNGVWHGDVREMKAPFGRHEYKFIVDGKWEGGDNRLLHINAEGVLERPPDIIYAATIVESNIVDVVFNRTYLDKSMLTVRVEPGVEIVETSVVLPQQSADFRGYAVDPGLITFNFSEAAYAIDLQNNARVIVTGNFNDWSTDGGNGRWVLRDNDHDDVWQVTVPVATLKKPKGETNLLFKFVVNGSQWMAPPPEAENRLEDAEGNVNLRIDRQVSGRAKLQLKLAAPLDLSQAYMLIVEGLSEKPLRHYLSPGKVLDEIMSYKELGVILDRKQVATTYRVFAPRAKRVKLCIYDRPEYEVKDAQNAGKFKAFDPVERYPMWKDQRDGVWEISLLGLDIGKYYSFNIEGPAGDGEGFEPGRQVGDPYARAVAKEVNNSIVIDPDETNEWFSGWTDHAYEAPKHEDVVVYETHVRDLSIHPSSGVSRDIAGSYRGILATEGTGTGLDHLRDMGFNMIELMPIAEFDNGTNDHHWGYVTTFFFAPEASYGTEPLMGSQYFEFKHLVNELHNKGFGVILDVVYNHVGMPNVFSLIDRKYFFRLNPNFTFMNFSGVGNDVRSEAPMMRRFIVENVLYWMREHHVDGFRFDLCELIDMQTLMEIQDAARRLNPNVLLISEPWSFRGNHKDQLTGTKWAAWNDDFRNRAKAFVMGERNRDELREVIAGSASLWAANPLQTVNYIESHDDWALADELSTRSDRDGSHLQINDVRANGLAATILFTSLGIPMVAEGQEFIRSKFGIKNSHEGRDAVNALRWTDRERPIAAEALAYYKDLIHLRQSEAGAAFRVASKAPADYYQWITPTEEQALGYIVNVPRVHKGAGFIVLLNASAEDVAFDVPFGTGLWRLIGDGERISLEGMGSAHPPIPGPVQQRVTVPSNRAYIFKDGF